MERKLFLFKEGSGGRIENDFSRKTGGNESVCLVSKDKYRLAMDKASDALKASVGLKRKEMVDISESPAKSP